MTPLITIFTPTYNRAHTLPQLYESLCRQTCKDFIWSIVDDGSSDNTEDVIRQWTAESRVEIRYTKQPNGGKMRAHNLGARICTTTLFVCVDSDDFVPDTFVEQVKRYWPQIQSDDKMAGIIAYKSIKGGDGEYRVRCHFPFTGKSTQRNLYQGGFSGDLTLVFKTEILKRFPFLEVEGEKFSTEDFAYDQIDQAYEYILVDEAWTLCEYMPDGYSQAERLLYAKNPKGWALFFNQKAQFTHTYFSKKKMGYGILYMIFARRAGFKNIYQQSALKTPLYPLFWLLSYYYEWKWREKYPK